MSSRSCKYIQALTSLGEYDTRRVNNEKDSLKSTAKGSLMFLSKGLAVLPITDTEENISK